MTRIKAETDGSLSPGNPVEQSLTVAFPFKPYPIVRLDGAGAFPSPSSRTADYFYTSPDDEQKSGTWLPGIGYQEPEWIHRYWRKQARRSS